MGFCSGATCGGGEVFRVAFRVNKSREHVFFGGSEMLDPDGVFFFGKGG